MKIKYLTLAAFAFVFIGCLGVRFAPASVNEPIP